MNLGNPQLELIDPTPNIHLLFINFDKLFFTSRLSNRVVVRWSKRMYSCAGICSYETGTGFCDIALSEPLLKLRPRKDLVETLLHEMIHAYLFVTDNDRDRSGHGPNFQMHMHRINNSAGLNISIYHTFYNEVKLYQTHVWRCNGSCQSMKPHFGIYRRSSNKAPGPLDYWWRSHQAHCGGTFIKIKQPDVLVKKKTKPKVNVITNYIPTNKISSNMPKKNVNPVLKDFNHNNKSNKNNGGMINSLGHHSPKLTNIKPLFNVKGQIIGGNRPRSNSANVLDTVRSVWINRQLVNTQTNEVIMSSSPNLNPNRDSLELHHIENTPAKVQKIDDFFKTTASSVLKNIYGGDIKVAQSNDGTKLVAVSDVNLVPCPVCNVKLKNDCINRHLDECLNRGIIDSLNKNTNNIDPASNQHDDRGKLKKIVGPIQTIPKFKEVSRFNINNEDIKIELPDSLDTSLVNKLFNNQPKKQSSASIIPSTSNQLNTKNPQSIVNRKMVDKRKSADMVIPKAKQMDSHKVGNMTIKTEPGTSKDTIEITKQLCPCCNCKFEKQLSEHLDQCVVLCNTNWDETDKFNEPIVIDDDDDIFDESLTLNASGTKTPCPCCFEMIEYANMNDHLNLCLE